jgi:hypothetical protein
MLCLRALVPVGFMLVPVDGRAVIVLCDSDAQAPAPHHSHDQAGHTQHTHADPTCPYAQSAGPAPLPALPVLAAGPAIHFFVPPERLEQLHAHFGPFRQQYPRGPPHFA